MDCRGGMVALAIHRCRKPTIAAIQGPAVGVSLPFLTSRDLC